MADDQDIEPQAEASAGDDTQKQRKVYQPTLFEDRRRRHVSPWVVIPVLLVILAAVFTVLYIAQHRVRFVASAGEIVYAADQESAGVSHLWVIRDDGTDAHRLLSGIANDSQPVFAPDGSEIVFLSDRDQHVNQLFLVGADGQDVLQITRDPGDKTLPAWQPGSSHSLGYIASGAVDMVTIGSEIGTPDRLLPPAPATRQAQDLEQQLSQQSTVNVPSFAWSPASNAGLAAVEDTGSFQALCVMPDLDSAAIDTRGTAQSQAPLFSAGTMSLGWSPNGKMLAVAAINVNGVSRPMSGIFLFSQDGSMIARPSLVVGSSTVGPQNPIFSPDGSRILFEAWSLPDLASLRRLGLYSVPVSGGQPAQLIYKGDVSDVQFAPDGTMIYFLLGRSDGGNDLCRVDSDGTGFARLTNGSNVTSFSISPQAVSK